jgi:protein O-mannosyl-transferase
MPVTMMGAPSPAGDPPNMTSVTQSLDRSSPPKPKSRGHLARASTAVLALSVLAFAGVLGGELVWDDRMLADGSAIGGGDSLLRCFTEPFLWHFFRPLVSVAFFFERMLWRGDALGYHITNLLLHLAGTLVMMRLLDEAFRSRWTTVLGGLFFAIHPVQVGAVAWIGGRTDSMASLWVLICLWMLVRSARSPVSQPGPWLVYSVVFYNLAIYTKEQCLGLLLLVPFTYRIWKPESGVRLPRTGLYASLPLLASTAVFLSAGYYLGMPRPSHLPYSAGQTIELVGTTVWYYAMLIVTPAPTWMHRLSLEGFAGQGPWPAAAGYAAIALLAGLWFHLVRRDPASAWFLGVMVLLFLPVSNLLPLPFLVVAPYRAALPWIGGAALVGRFFGRALEHVESNQSRSAFARLLPWAVALVVVWHGVLTVWGSLQWRRESTFFAQVTSHDPRCIVAKTIYTYSLEREKRPREAARVEEQALTLVFGSDAWREWSTADAAIRHDPKVTFRARRNQGNNDDPRIWIAGLYAQLANCLEQTGDHDSAQRYLSIGDGVWSNHLNVHLGMGHYALRRGDLKEAERRYKMALSIQSKNAFARSGLGRTYAALERWAEAAAEFEELLRILPANEDAKRRLEAARSRLDGSRSP